MHFYKHLLRLDSMGVLLLFTSSFPSPTFSSDESNNTEQTEQNDYVNPAKHGILQYIPKCFDTLLDVWYAWKITNTGIISLVVCIRDHLLGNRIKLYCLNDFLRFCMDSHSK